MLELHALQVFLVAAETENFSETGRILQMSQPAVSGHIQALENRLNTRLFDRTGRNIKLNELGEAFVPVVRKLLREARLAEEFIAAQHGQLVGEISVGCSTATGKYLLPRVMARFLDVYPAVRLSCLVGPRGEALDRLIAGDIDLAVSSLRVPHREIEYRHVADDQLVLIAPPDHPWAQAGVIRPQDLLDHEIILRESTSGTAGTLNRELAALDLSLEVLKSRFVLGSTEAIVQAVMEGAAPGFASYLIAAPALRQEAVVQIEVEGLVMIQRLYMARHTNFRPTEAQKAFWEFVFAPENSYLRQIVT